MRESSWEASRRKQHKTKLLFFLIVVPVLVLAGILFTNNRDLIDRALKSRSIHQMKGTIQTALSPDSARTVSSDSTAPSAASAPSSPVPVLKNSEKAVPQKNQVAEEPAVYKPVAGNTPEMISPPMEKLPKLRSIVLPSFPCRIESRKDVVIYLSLELFFNDIEKRSAILLRREDIKVMAMRTVHGKELNDIKIGELESQLLQNINKIFEHAEITAVKIGNIQVEKAVKQ
jgi:hypothetical protein